MKRFVCITAAAVLLLGCRKDNVSQDSFALFDDAQLPVVTVRVSEGEWNRLLELYDSDSRTKEYVRCGVSVSMDGRTQKVTDAGLRLRGQTSRRRPEGSGGRRHTAGKTDWHHFHFGLHFNKFSDSPQQIDGYRRINFKYPKEDPTYIREHYCYDLLSRYGVWTAPSSSWCRLYLHVGSDPSAAYYGVHLMVESIDRQYLRKRPEFGSSDGFLWKCAWGANLRDYSPGRFVSDTDSPDTHAYELKEDDPELLEPAKAQMKDFIGKLNSLQGDVFRNWIGSVCDVELLLRTYAVNVAVGHWDDYWNNMNNFYLYFNSRDETRYRIYMLPYDYDNTLGTSHYCGVQSDSGRHDPYNWGLKECPLISKVLSVSEYREMYTRFLRELGAEGNRWFGYEASLGRITRWQDLFGPYLDNDTGEDTSLRDRPASWGNHPEYRVMQDGASNWFRVKAGILNSL